MTKSASRIVVAVVALAAILGVFSIADAQDSYTPTTPVRGATYQPPQATANSGFLGFGSLNPVSSGATGTVDGGDTTATGGTGGGLALTGSEANVGLAVGIGLLAVGGTAVVASRKRDDE